MNIKKRKVFIDWQNAEQRMAGRKPDSELPIGLIQGVVCVGLVILALWLIWGMK